MFKFKFSGSKNVQKYSMYLKFLVGLTKAILACQQSTVKNMIKDIFHVRYILKVLTSY